MEHDGGKNQKIVFSQSGHFFKYRNYVTVGNVSLLFLLETRTKYFTQFLSIMRFDVTVCLQILQQSMIIRGAIKPKHRQRT